MITTTLIFLADAAADAQKPPGWASFVPMVLMLVIFYFVLIRPQQKRTSDLQALVSRVKTGDKVVTTGGIHGIVSNAKDGPTLILKIADNVKIEVDKSAIATVEKSGNSSPSAPAAAVS